MKKILTKLFAAISSIFYSFTMFSSALAADDSICDNPKISDEIKAASGCPSSTNVETLDQAVIDILKAIILVCGVVAVIWIIIGGVQYMSSTGEPVKTKKAKDTILYACIGLIICALSFVIVQFVISDLLAQQ